MPAKLHVTGPAHVYVGHKTALPAAGIYLGTCEKSPSFQTRFAWDEVLNDIAGSAPIDLIFKGMVSKIDILLSRFNEDNVLNFSSNTGSRAVRHGAAHQPGIVDSGQIGSLSEYSHASVVSSGYWLALKFEFAQETALDSYLPQGYFFPSVSVTNISYAKGAKSGAGGNGSLGTNAKKISLEVAAHASVVQPGVHGITGSATSKAGMTSDGDYVLRLYSTDPTVFAFASLPAFD